MDKGKELCRICFCRRRTYINIFETFVMNNMTIADMFMHYLGENIYPDDNLPECICCDCIEEVMEAENMSETCKVAVKYLIWHTKLIKHLKLLQERERLTESPSNLKLQKFISEYQLAHGNYKHEESGKHSFPLLCKKKTKVLHQIDFDILEGYTGSGTKYYMKKENNLELCEHYCSLCGGVFLNAKELNRHEELFHDVYKCFPCGKCHKKFKTVKSLERHIYKHNFMCKYQGGVPAEETVQDPSCNVCIQSSSTPTISENIEPSKAKRRSSQRENVTYSCGKCDCSFESTKGLRAHLREIHSSMSPCICGLCNAGFLSKFDLELHKYIHPKEFSCEVCKRQFSFLRSYQKHSKFCKEKIVVYKCQFCGKEVSSKYCLKRHIATHSLVKRYECHICHQKYRGIEDIYRHQRSVHLKQKPHECGICQKSFSVRHNLVLHIKTHSDERRYSCSFCDKKFKRHDHKWRHEKIIHNHFSKPQEKYIVAEEILKKAFLINA